MRKNEKEIIEANLLIASFDNWEPIYKGADLLDYVGEHERGVIYVRREISDLQYHKSWNYIMPVAMRLARDYSIDCVAKSYTIEEIYERVVDAVIFLKENNYTSL